MKALARSYIWWPKIDQDIEGIVKKCESCLRYAKNPNKAMLHVWEYPDGPNERLHTYFLGPVKGKWYMVIIDAYSKWIDVKHTRDLSAESAVKAFREYFSVWGLTLHGAKKHGSVEIVIVS